MRTWTETHREGTKVSAEIDWSHEMVAHACRFKGITVELLKELAANPSAFRVSNYGGELSLYSNVLDVCMYDGWPYWKPGPALLIAGPLGPEWMWLGNLTRVERK